ncbi:hypothetical protein BDF14DRAFT_883149 [Spinellus fusiger]|nr:hypothetical protein BDF14DRAFT_883149 [Spinellus fusiger]
MDTMHTSSMQIRVLGVPQTGAKSRVETQIKLCIQLVTDDGDKAQWWSHLKLPEHMVARDKLKRQMLISTTPSSIKIDSTNLPIKQEKILFLNTRVICASDPSRKVTTCIGCIQRECKRSQRRKEKKTSTEAENEKSLTEDEKSLALEEQKVLLFNCPEIVDFSSGDTILPTRITCYCRHHNERLGFCIYFEMLDHTGKQVATGMSPPIMITDDHKSNKIKSGRKRARTDMETSAASFTPTSNYESPSIAAPLSVNATPNDTPTPTPTPVSTPTPAASASLINKTDPLQFHMAVGSSNSQSLFDQKFSLLPVMTDAIMSQNSQQIAKSLQNGFQLPIHPTPSSMILVEKHTSPVILPPVTNNDRPQLQRLIPNEGPTYGGIEVTILGSGFRPGPTCMFGETAASSTHYWSSNTLVCILPPAVDPGTVVFSFKEYPVLMDSENMKLFTYYNENDRALMELALQVVGLKMTGKVEDAREIAMRIVQGGNQTR